MLRRLRVKFVCINMIITTAMLLVIFALVIGFTAKGLENANVQMMRSAAAELMLPGKPGFPGELRRSCFVVQLGPHDKLAVIGGGYNDLSEESLLRLVEAALAAGTETGVLEEYALRFCMAERQRIVFADVSGERAAVRSLLWSCVAAGAAAFLVFLGASLLLARWAVKPVETAWAQQRQFVADASHELKTPLTVILTNAELLEDPSFGEKERGLFAQNILTMSHRMRGLVEELLELARVDAGAVKTDGEMVDLSGLAAEALLPFEPLYFEKGLELTAALEEGLLLRGDRTHLHQVVDVLLDNAMKYSPAGSSVTVGLKRQEGKCLLWVANPGEPMTPEELRAVFKRFYRKDQARPMERGYGLGLPIAEGIVKAHRGRIWAESGEGVNTFYVELPTVR